MSDTHHIDSEEVLAEFRSTLFSAGSLAPIIDANPAALINAPTGIGKSWLIDELIDYYLAGAVYKLIVVLTGLTVSLPWAPEPRPAADSGRRGACPGRREAIPFVAATRLHRGAGA